MEKRCLFVIGNTNAGKSSMCNELSGQQIAVVGQGNGTSTTQSAQTYRFSSLQLNLDMAIVDFPGFLDTNLALSDEEITQHVKTIVAECLSDEYVFYGFIVAVSLEDEINHHITNINRLTQILGGGIQSNIIIAVTHCDEMSVTQDEIDRRYPQIEDECDRIGASTLKWSNAPGYQLAHQVSNLRRIIEGLRPVNCAIITEIETLVQQEAQAMAARTPLPTDAAINAESQRIANLQPHVQHTVVENVNTMVQVPYTVQEPRTRTVNCTETYTGSESYTVPVTKTVARLFTVTRHGTKRHKGIGGSFGLTKSYSWQETEWRDVQETVNETRERNVTKTRPTTRQENYTVPVVYHRNETRVVPTPRTYMAPPNADLYRETVRINLTAVPANFMSEARRSISNRLREQLAVN